jgi:hypothetical protein
VIANTWNLVDAVLGAVLCRYQAQEIAKLWSPQLEEMGISVACIVHQALPAECALFKDGFWPSHPLYLDSSLSFYQLTQGGKLVRGSRKALLNPFGALWKRTLKAMKHVKDHNVVVRTTSCRCDVANCFCRLDRLESRRAHRSAGVAAGMTENPLHAWHHFPAFH